MVNLLFAILIFLVCFLGFMKEVKKEKKEKEAFDELDRESDMRIMEDIERFIKERSK